MSVEALVVLVGLLVAFGLVALGAAIYYANKCLKMDGDN